MFLTILSLKSQLLKEFFGLPTETTKIRVFHEIQLVIAMANTDVVVYVMKVEVNVASGEHAMMKVPHLFVQFQEQAEHVVLYVWKQ